MFKVRMFLVGVGTIISLLGHTALAGSVLCPGTIVVVDFNTDSVIQIDPVSGNQTSISAGGLFKSLFGVAVEKSGDIVVLDRSAFPIPGVGIGGVLRINPLTGQQSTIAASDGFLSPMGLALGLGGEILVSNFFGDDVLSIDPVTGNNTLLTADGFLAGPMGMVVRSDGELFIADNDGGSIIQVNIATGQQTLVTLGGLVQGPAGIAIESDGNLVVTDANSGRIVRVNPDTGQQSIVSSGLSQPTGIVVEADGNLLVTVYTTPFPQVGSIIRINPITGSQSVVATGGLLSLPTGIAIIPNLLADINQNGTVNIDDLVAVLNGFGACPAPPVGCVADITPSGGNGVVNIDDLVAVLNAFGACP